MIHRVLFRRSGRRHTIYLTVRDGVVEYAPPVHSDWIGKSLPDVLATLPKKHKHQVWTDKWI